MTAATPQWFWDPAATPEELHTLLTDLGEVYPLSRETRTGRELRFERLPDSAAKAVVSEVTLDAAGARIGYNTVAAAGRGVGSAMAGLAGRESTPFSMLGIMLDCSRNMVFTVPALTKIFRRLAMLGYNTVFLYCEDTYEIPEEPFFGMMRGRYTAAEIRTADAVAAGLGIELIGCMQTLGHFSQILRWTQEYRKIRDTASVMMVDAPESRRLIGKMLDFWKNNLRSRRIHVGMDETHDLGRGRYLDHHGYANGFTLFTRHLNAVMECCRERGLQPIIWGDMFFRLGNPEQNYHVLDSPILPEVQRQIPRDLQLVYWDYYHSDQDFYEKFIDLHRQFGFEPLMGAGAWIWSRLWYDHALSGVNNRACVAACRKKNLKELFFTIWADDGAIGHFNSVWTGLTEAADLAYGHDDAAATAARYQALTGSDYELNRLPGRLPMDFADTNLPLALLYDDLLLGMAWHNLRLEDPAGPDRILAEYRAIREALAPHRDDRGGGDLGYAWQAVNFLLEKLQLRQALTAAYAAHDRQALVRLREEIPALVTAFDAFTAAFRAQWLADAKVFGLETLQHRFGGQRERLLEAGRRLDDLLAGRIPNLPELEAEYGNHPERMQIYSQIASPSVIQ